MASRKDLALTIMQMNYGALRDACAELASANADKEARPKLETAEEFADLLYDWPKQTPMISRI